MLRRPMLYPTELRALNWVLGVGGRLLIAIAAEKSLGRCLAKPETEGDGFNSSAPAAAAASNPSL